MTKREYRPSTVFHELASVKELIRITTVVSDGLRLVRAEINDSKQAVYNEFYEAIKNDDTLLTEIVSRNIGRFDDVVAKHIGEFEGGVNRTGSDTEDLLTAIRCDDALFDAVVSDEFECMYIEIEGAL
jgi:hypothetical protein